MTSTSENTARRSEAWFLTTHWSVVLSARDESSPRSAEALERLCGAYWYPLYAFVRRQGRAPHDAEDLVQGFFARLLEKDYLKAVDPERGRFRTFLIMALKRFLANEWDRQHAQKRGGLQPPLPLDTALAESRYQQEAALAIPADLTYDRQWAVTLLDRVLGRLRQEQERQGRGKEFQTLSRFLTVAREAISYRDAAEQLGVSEPAARMAVHRLRRAYREAFREEIAHTVARPEDIEEEIRHLLDILSR